MDRRQFLVASAAALVAFAGCSRVAPPSEPTPKRLPAPTRTPSPTPGAVTRAVAAGTTPAESVMQALAMKALDARGYSGQMAPMPSGGTYGLSAAVGANQVAFAVGFAATLLASIAAGDEPPAPDDLVPTLAGALEPDGVAVLQASPADGHLIWVVRPGASIKDMSGLSGWKGKKASVPSFVVSRADGIPALEAVYGAKLTVVTDDDTSSRHDALVAGNVDLSVFRACDTAELTGLQTLDDSNGITQSDPMIMLFDDWLTDGDPGAVLAVTDTLAALNVDQFAALEESVAHGTDAASVATAWIAGHLPAG